MWSGEDFVQSLAPDKSVRWQTKLKSDLTNASGQILKPIANGGVLVLGHAYPDHCTTPEGDQELRRGLVAWLDERGTLLWQVTLKQSGWIPVEQVFLEFKLSVRQAFRRAGNLPLDLDVELRARPRCPLLPGKLARPTSVRVAFQCSTTSPGCPFLCRVVPMLRALRSLS